VRRDPADRRALPVLAHERALWIKILIKILVEFLPDVFDLQCGLRHDRPLNLDRRFGVRIALCCHKSIASSHCAPNYPATVRRRDDAGHKPACYVGSRRKVCGPTRFVAERVVV
jgi:hypothetical protein